jgi:hypothetical protein
MKRALVLVAFVMGCHQEKPVTSAPPVTITSAELASPPNDEAIVRVATAHCERDLACNKIGQGRIHEDFPSCLESEGELMNKEIGRGQCPLGVDQTLVARCISDIRNTVCGGVLEKETNLPVCTGSVICLTE